VDGERARPRETDRVRDMPRPLPKERLEAAAKSFFVNSYKTISNFLTTEQLGVRQGDFAHYQ